MMRRTYFLLLTACGAMVASQTCVFAGPPAHSLRASARAPAAASGPSVALPPAAGGAAANSAASRGISQRAGDTARMTNGFSRAAAGMSRAAGNVRPPQPGALPPQAFAPGGVPAVAQQPLHGSEAVRAAAQHTFDQRLLQADHLDAIADQNGNEKLREAAQRMRDQAQQQFDAANQRIDAMPGAATDDSEGTGITQASAAEPSTSAAALPSFPAPPVAKPSWRERIHFAWPFNR